MTTRRPLVCDFCGKGRFANRIIQGANASICLECVGVTMLAVRLTQPDRFEQLLAYVRKNEGTPLPRGND